MHAPVKVGVVGLGIRGFWIAYLAGQCEGVALKALADSRPCLRHGVYD